MSLHDEEYVAKRGGAEAAASIAYFDARLPIDTTQNQKIFRDGFERAYDLREKNSPPSALRSQSYSVNWTRRQGRPRNDTLWFLRMIFVIGLHMRLEFNCHKVDIIFTSLPYHLPTSPP